MLKFIRKKGIIKRLIWVVAILIIISFGFLGTAYLLNDVGQQKYAGKIFNRNVDIAEFQSVYKDVNIQGLIQYGDRFYDIRNELNLPQQTWDRIILLEEAKKQGIKVTDEEVVDAIQQFEFFQADGSFDPYRYQTIVSNTFRTSPRKFEENIRDSIKLAKLQSAVTAAIRTSEEEILEQYRLAKEKVQVSYVTIKPETFENDVNASDEELRSHFEQNKVRFIMPESIKVAYVKFPYPEGATDDQENSVFEKAYDVLNPMLSGSNLQEAAAQSNLEVKETGYFSKQYPDLSLKWPLETLNTLFQFDTGESTDPFENESGVFIAELVDRKDAYLPEFEEAKNLVLKSYRQKHAKDLARNAAQEINQDIQEAYAQSHNDDFKAIALELGLEIQKTPLFQRGQYLPQIGLSQEFVNTAFSLSDENPLSTLVETDSAFYVLHFEDYEGIDQEEFDKERLAIQQQIIVQKRNESFTDFLTKLRLKADFENFLNEDNDN